ncbi:hypothetical protein [Halobacillus andaensis]|uniref:hypothetical protein n=1 Tax=Halobacillus andaensis TaxID=1176239 RepID=UPI003D763A86
MFVSAGIIGCSTVGDTSSAEEEQESGSQDMSVTFESGAYTMVGIEDKAGFINGSTELPVNDPNKYMWHVWGEDVEGRSFTVTGKNLDTGEEETLVDSELAGPNNEADAHAPSIMTFPSAGEWELIVYVGDNQFETMRITVADS